MPLIHIEDYPKLVEVYAGTAGHDTSPPEPAHRVWEITTLLMEDVLHDDVPPVIHLNNVLMMDTDGDWRVSGAFYVDEVLECDETTQLVYGFAEVKWEGDIPRTNCRRI